MKLHQLKTKLPQFRLKSGSYQTVPSFTFTTVLFFTLFLLFQGCKKDNNDEEGKLRVLLSNKLTTSEYLNININIKQVQAEYVIDSGRNLYKWETLDSRTGLIDLMNLTSDARIIGFDSAASPGIIRRIRIFTGDSNTIVTKDGFTHDLIIPEGISGINIDLNSELVLGKTLSVFYDVDISQSVAHEEESSIYTITPFFRVAKIVYSWQG